MRNKISISLALSAAIFLLASPLLIFNLPPVQAQSNFSFRTTKPADGIVQCSSTGATLTFDAQGTPSSADPQRMDITGGTFQISERSEGGQILYNGNIHNGRFSNSSAGGGLDLYAEVNHVASGTYPCASTGNTLVIVTSCSTSNANAINVGFLGQGLGGFGTFHGAVDCSQRGGDTTTQQSSSSSMNGTTTQDGDGDGIVDANDNCSNLPHTMCYKEGDTAIVAHSNR